MKECSIKKILNYSLQYLISLKIDQVDSKNKSMV